MSSNDRTTPIGLFLFAYAYAEAAEVLRNADTNAGHRDAPIRYLFTHAVELYLKAYLRAKGLTIDELRRRPYSHDTKSLLEKSEEFGLYLTLDLVSQIEFIANDTSDRYIVTGTKKVLLLNSFSHLCESLHDRICPDVLKAEGLTRAPFPYGRPS